MRIALVVLGVAWILWTLLIREIYIHFKYKNPRPIRMPSAMTKEELYGLLSEKLYYPGQKSLNYNANGDILINCKYGEHIIEIENDILYVTRNGSRRSKNIEEAECIDAYIRKIFNSGAPVDPYAQYKKMNSHKMKYIIANIVLTVGIVAGSLAAFWFGGYNDIYMSNDISRSYLKKYSSSVTVGEAFDNFFSDGKWSKFSNGGLEYVDYTGECIYNDEPVSVCIRFWNSDKEFRVEKIMIDGIEALDITEFALLNAIYDAKPVDKKTNSAKRVLEMDTAAGDSQESTETAMAFISGEKKFTDIETKKQTTIYSLPKINSSYMGNPSRWTAVDIDADGQNEIVFEYDGMGDTAILHQIDGKYYAYYVPFRGIKELKYDGTMSGSNGADDGSVSRINFSEYGMLYVDLITFNGNDGVYTVDGVRVSKNECEKALKEQDAKEDAEWFTIEASVKKSYASSELEEMHEYLSIPRLFYNVEKRFGKLTYENTVEGGDYYYTKDGLLFVFADGDPQCRAYGMPLTRAYPGIEEYAGSDGYISRASLEKFFDCSSTYTESEMFYGGWLDFEDADVSFECNEKGEIYVEQYVFFNANYDRTAYN